MVPRHQLNPFRPARIMPRLSNACSVALAILVATVGATAATAAPKLNIVLFLIDEPGWRDLRCQGSTRYQTPDIDRLAREGVRSLRLEEATLAECRFRIGANTRSAYPRVSFAAAQPALVVELWHELDTWRRSVGAGMMQRNPDYDPAGPAPAKAKKKQKGLK